MKDNIILGTSCYNEIKDKEANTVSIGGDGGKVFGYNGNSYKKLSPRLETFMPYAEKYNKLHEIRKYLTEEDYKLYRNKNKNIYTRNKSR